MVIKKVEIVEARILKFRFQRKGSNKQRSDYRNPQIKMNQTKEANRMLILVKFGKTTVALSKLNSILSSQFTIYNETRFKWHDIHEESDKIKI